MRGEPPPQGPRRGTGGGATQVPDPAAQGQAHGQPGPEEGLLLQAVQLLLLLPEAAEGAGGGAPQQVLQPPPAGVRLDGEPTVAGGLLLEIADDQMFLGVLI